MVEKTKKEYTASAWGLREDVRKIYSQLEKLGYSVSHDWTQHKSIRPYKNNPKLAEEYSVADSEGVENSDLFIIITNKDGIGMHTEFGIALEHFLKFKKPIIYVVGEYLNDHFFFHPAVKRRKTIEEVIKELKELN